MNGDSAPKNGFIKRTILQVLLICSGLLSILKPGSTVDRDKKVGGQAVIEGVMMRGQDHWSVMVRTPEGNIIGQTKPHKAWTSRKPLKFPFLRGLVVLGESLVLGVKALNYSTEIAAAAAVASEKKAKKLEAESSDKKAEEPKAESLLTKDTVLDSSPGPTKDKAIHPLFIFFSIAMGLGLGLFLFVALPHILSILFGSFLGGYDESTLLFHVLDGLLKFVIFLLYIWLIGFIPDIARVYAYHGAEHQAIHVYEAGLPLEPAQAKSFPTWHPRCGTAFIFLVLAASILFFAILFPLLAPFENLSRFYRAIAGVGLKILFTPLLASLAYEVTKLAARPKAGFIFRAMVWPGLLLQRLTTRLPDDSMLEVSFKSLEEVIVSDKPLALTESGLPLS
ncbi:MAG: DUF1385 domain-containing protein [Deltaproteobacteria bacterium]|jgi:uncharacterized protein YqhQ|nr:DUF1385 domain-containing protein [Deltaproteobacteria bacterium]